jgi:hypothetical protein
VGGVFDEPVESFDGVPQGGVGLVPGRAAVGQVLACNLEKNFISLQELAETECIS